MPNLQKWIEEQLKKGYSKKELKSVLSKKNYPKHVISEVDKIGSSPLPNRKLFEQIPSKPIVLILLFIIFIFVFWSFGWLPFSLQQESGISVSDTSSDNLCDEFKDAGYAVPCEEVADLALEYKPGKISNIELGTRKVPILKGGNMSLENKILWLFDIKLYEPFYDNIQNKETNELRVGIGTKDSSFTYWEEIE